MKRLLLIAVVALMTTLSAVAQRIQVVDTDGNPVSYASVMTTDAKYIGITDLNGMLADVKGATDVVISHVAFKTKNAKIDRSAGTQVITVEDADFGLNEITVQPKPYVYVQTYYRVYSYYSNDTGIVYYRAGLTDNVYDRAKKKVSSSTDHVAKAKYGIIKFEDRLLDYGKEVDLKITDLEPGKRIITDIKDTIGYIIDDMEARQRHFSYNSTKVKKHKIEIEGKEKQLAKLEKREEKRQNREESEFQIYLIDEDGNYVPEDFVMKQDMDSYDEMEDGEMVHKIFCFQVFSTDRAYVDKAELKQRKKDNKMKLTYENIEQFERQHNIPPLPPAVQQKINEVWKVDKE